MSRKAVPPSQSPRVRLEPVAPPWMRNCPDPVRLYRVSDGKAVRVPCRRRRCPYCGPVHWRPRALAGYHAGIFGDPQEFLAVLLTAPGDVNVDDWNADASGRWHRFMTILRRDYPGLQFWRVAELQARGAIHFHVLFRGRRFMAHGKIRRAALAVGFGSWVGVRSCWKYRRGASGAALYFGKYLLKDFPRFVRGVTKLVTFSNGWRVVWRKRERSVPGTWLYAGGMRSGWSAVGFVRVPEASSIVRLERPRWWRQAWQWQRARWAPTVGIDTLL